MQKHLINKLIILFLIATAVSACMSPENPKGKERQNEQTESQSKKLLKSVDTRIVDEDKEETDREGAEKVVEDTASLQATIKNLQQNKPFTLHIPSGYDEEEQIPVIFIFDPHARGRLAVNKYSDLADEFGFLLVGSNQSRNNQPIEDGLKYYREMKSGIGNRVEIDPGRIYTMGFSGGARVAVSIAIQEKEVQAVIGCGAGFPAIQRMPSPDFYYFGLVGYEDFNMGELINNDRVLSRSGFDNELAIFDGGHDWPTENVMREAFIALEIRHITDTDKTHNAMVTKAIDFYNTKIDAFTSEDRYFDAAETAERAASVLEPVVKTDDFKSQMRSFKKKPRYREDLSAMVKTMEKETGLQNNYLAAFENQGLTWWKSELQKLKTPVDDVFEERLNRRLEAFLGLMAYMMSSKAISEKDFVKAKKTLEIYRLIEPVNPEHAYLGAVVMMELGDEKAAEGYLEQAIVLGFNNVERLRQESAFDGMERRQEFLEMLSDTP